jgi:hypothetical protein
MKAEELRIGNLIYSSSGSERVVVGTSYKTILHSKSLDSVTYYEDYESNCKPIPLTEEILSKCGFDKTDDYGDIIYFELKIRNNVSYYVCFDHEDISFGLNVFENCTPLIYDEKHFQYIHQLQNLIYSLTNQELKIQIKYERPNRIPNPKS